MSEIERLVEMKFWSDEFGHKRLNVAAGSRISNITENDIKKESNGKDEKTHFENKYFWIRINYYMPKRDEILSNF